MTGRLSERTLLTALFAVLAIVFAVNLLGASSFIHDDAYIGFRYVRNLIGHGDLSWNVGDKVEGYTNFLDLVLIAGLVKLGLPHLIAARLLHGLALISMFALATWRAGELALEHKTRARVFAAAALMTTGAIPIWLWGGLETLLAAAFVTAGVAFAAPVFVKAERAWKDCLIAGVFFALAVATRPDNVVAGFVTGLCLLLFMPAPLTKRIVPLAAFAVGPVLIVGAQELFRLSYYGDILPNTFRAKAGAPLDMTLRFAAEYVGVSIAPVLMLWLFLAFFGIGFARKGAGQSERALWYIGAVVGLQIVYIVLLGGDHMPGARFFIPVTGAAAIGIGVLAARGPLQHMMALAGTLFFAGALSFADTITHWNRIDKAALVGEQVGRYIAANTPKGSLIAVHTAGSTPWFAPDNTYIDMIGLNDRTIAKKMPTAAEIERAPHSMPGHLRGDGAYVLSREPDYIVLGPAEGTDAEHPWFISDLDLIDKPDFARCYVKQVHALPVPHLRRAEHRDTLTWYQRTCPKTRG